MQTAEQQNPSALEEIKKNTAQLPDICTQEDILNVFEPEDQKIITRRHKILSSLAYFIGKDFRIPIKLGKPGSGWRWDATNNIIYADSLSLLNRSMDYLRYVISHEGAHRRISRADFIPIKEWNQPGFSAMMNSIEDPRVNNFTIDSYPKFQEQLESGYLETAELRKKAREEAEGKCGFQPKFMQATFEYINRWFSEVYDGELESDVELLPDDVRESVGGVLLSEDEIEEDVKEVVNKTIVSAQDSWWTYPDRDEADESEQNITDYSFASYEINRNKIWPEFKKLVEADMKNQQIQEMLQEMSEQNEAGESLPQELIDQLTSELIKELMKTLEDMVKDASQGKGKGKGKGSK